MELYGTVAENLQLAIRSARRFRGKAVHSDTVAYWKNLLCEARLNLNNGSMMPPSVEALVLALENEISERSAPDASDSA